MKNQPQKNTLTAADFRAAHVDQVEHNLQTTCVSWFKLAYPQLMLFAIPNAAKRSFALAVALQQEGMIAGLPDLMLAYPCHNKPGLFIEMKTVNGDPSPKQILVQAYLRGVGYEVAMPRTFEQFQNAVWAYLSDNR